jgi:phage replication-related protein YjqB (UPF0714/DUF867 family)
VAVTDTGHLTEFLADDGRNEDVLVCAGHAGDVEPGTGELAIELAARVAGSTCWATFGYDDADGAYDAWHPPSKAITPAEYPLLGDIADRGFDRVVSIHGLGDDEVIVGGGIDGERKERVRDRLDGALSVPVRTVSEGPYAGVHPENFVNWLAADGGGLQLELGETARAVAADAVLDELERVMREQ